MRRLALACLLLFCLLPARATDCPQHFAFGQPPVLVKASLEDRTRELCFRAFAVLHSGVSRTPLWAAEHLVRANLEAARALVRRDAFHAEKRLPADERAKLSDFVRSGLERGHLAPNADFGDPESQAESFSLANIVPQDHASNVGLWAGIESAVRQLAIAEGELYVVTGPAFVGGEIGSLKGRVLIPTHLWKAVYSPKRQQAGVYLVTNDDTKSYSALSLADLERLVGIRALPALPQGLRDTAMELPRPRSQHGPRKKKGATTPEPEEFSLGDAARRALGRLLRSLSK